MPDPIRWLHLSDFHVGKDDYGQRRMFKYIINEIEAKIASHIYPDFVFITGDIANRGAYSEYEEFIDGFIYPLMELLNGQTTRIFIVPGNHDVDRSQAKALQAHGLLSRIPEFLDPTPRGLKERVILLPRFAAFMKADLPDTGGKWLDLPDGSFIHSLDVKGHKIGVLGLNTAWLSENDRDRHELCPGKGIIETGLEALKDCDVRIVLGHHPLDWFTDNEVKQIRALFGRYNVIYLHGHLHKNDSSREDGAGKAFLVIQAGASFQAREDELWVNRLLWCDINFETNQIGIEPLQWNKGNQEWVIDSLALPNRYRQQGTDRWLLTLPISQEIANESSVTLIPDHKHLHVPDGWLLVDEKFLDYYRVDLTSEQTLQFFDGRIPTWSEALSENVPRRFIVQELNATLSASKQAGELQVTLLLGAGGEGKSTALRQVICDLINSKLSWNILWHNNPDTLLPLEVFTELPESSGTWLIATDDADLIVKDIFEAVKFLHESGRRNVHFLLSCRDTDWKGASGEQFPWQQYTNFVTKHLRGLSSEDASLVIKAWSRYGKQGMGRLEKLNIQEAISQLVREAKSEAYAEEGAFLGAMLRARLGEDIKAHVTALLLRLNERPAPGGTLMQAFAYIAALHAENYLILSKDVLAEALGCKLRDVKRQIVGPLGEEAAATRIGQFILTRHRAIAETAVTVLSD